MVRKRFVTQAASLVLGTAVFALVAGCNRDEVEVYTVPKGEQASASERTASPMMGTMNSANADVPVNNAPISWTTPAGWKELPPNSIRLGNFSITTKAGKKAEVAITSFPGSVGSELDNWNRWRREVGLKDSTADEMTSEKVQVASREGKLYDLPGMVGRILVAVLPDGNATWFFKLKGEKEAVNETQPAFIEFLKSIKFEPRQGAAVASNAANDPHAGLNINGSDPHANIPGFKEQQAKAQAQTPAETASDDSGLPKWTVPAGWKEKPPGMMVTKSYSVAEDKATVAISVFPGDVGGTFANVNRWRGQLGMPPIKESDLAKETTTVEVQGAKATFVDFKGTDGKTGKPARMVAAIVPQGDSTWFYKLTGEDAVVGKEKESFTKFVQTVRY